MWIRCIFFANAIFVSYGFFAAEFINFVRLPNDECGNQIQMFKSELRNNKLWALKLLDASAKLQSGMLNGNFYNLGNFDECLAVKGQTSIGIIKGKYCLAGIPLKGWSGVPDSELREGRAYLNDILPSKNTSYLEAQYGICIPSACTADDVNTIIRRSFSFNITLNESYCQTDTLGPKITTGDITTMCLAGIIVLLLITSTTYDIYLYYSSKTCKSTLLLAFSVLTNGKKLFTVSDTTSHLSCLAGIRVITLMWIILGHSYSMNAFRPLTNYRSMFEWQFSTWSMYILGASVSVDTFFLMSGTLLTYHFLSYAGNFRIRHISIFYLHRYTRLIPALGAVLLVHLTIIKHLGSGPLWVFSTALTSDCESNWWRILSFTQNFTTVKCMPVVWYLSCDTQLYMMSPLILIPLKKRPRLMLKIVTCLAVISVGCSLWSCWYYEYHPFKEITPEYTATSTRASPWLIGIILGYIIHCRESIRTNLEINKFLIAILWIGSAAVMMLCVFGGNHLVTNPDGHRLESALRTAFVRPAWALAVSWILFACAFGYGGAVNKFLSLSIFQIVSRFGYSMYLIHWSILGVISLSSRTSIDETNSREIYMFWSIYMVTLFVGIIWTFMFEVPIVVVEKYIYKDSRNNLKETQIDQSKINTVKIKM